MEKINMEQKGGEHVSKETFSFKERVGRLLKASGVPIAFSFFLASCGGSEGKTISHEMLQEAKEKGAVVVPVSVVSDFESIIQKAKDEGKTVFLFDGLNSSESISVDTVENTVVYKILSDLGDEKVQVSDAVSIDDKDISFVSYIGATQQNALNADRKTGVVRKAVVDEGIHDAAYGVTNAGEIVGEGETGEKAVSLVVETVKGMKQKLEVN